ncbi:MAG: C25 family cysteine peptidase, partial [bacterium]
WSPPGSSSYKILVSEEGIYRLTRGYLETNGVDVDRIDLGQVRLYNRGEELAISVYDQNGDSHLDIGDYIEFYGEPVDAAYQKYTKNNVYWLILSGGSGSPERMAERDGTPGTAGVAPTHSATVHHEEDLWYWRLAPGGDSLDRWFFYPFVLGDGLVGGGNPVDFTVSVPDPVGSGTVTLYMLGTYNTDHQVRVSINGSQATFNWSGIAFYQGAMENVDLLNGDNTVTIECLSGEDSIGVDWIEVDYSRGFTAENDSLKFSYAAGSRFQVTGFMGSDILVFDITDGERVERILNGQITGSGPYAVEFEPSGGSGEETYLVLSSNAVKTPSGILPDAASTLSDTANGADYIVITLRGVGLDNQGAPYSWLNDLISLRQGQGLRTMVVDLEDIYDEFSYGIETPQAIRDFLTYAYNNWTEPSPRYVVFLGDGSYDYKDNWDWFLVDTTDYLPTYYVFTEYAGETVSDDWFARISGNDVLADIDMGRIPAANASQAEAMVGKIVAYEEAQNTKSWERNVLLVADDTTNPWEAVFETMNDDVAALMPTGLNASLRGYLNDYVSAVGLNNDIIDQIDAGALIVHYSGHAGRQTWAVKDSQSVFENEDVNGLANGTKLPFFVSMSCEAGDFVYPEVWNSPSLAEALLRPADKGAVAALMPTGKTTTPGQQILDVALFDAIFTQDIRTLGEAVSTAKQTLLANGAYDEVAETFLLFGDPAMELKVPLPRRPTGLSAQNGDGSVTLSWQPATDSDGGPVDGYNVYRSTTSGSGYTQVNGALITETSYVDTGLANGTTYYYVVTSVDISGAGSGFSSMNGTGDESVQSQEASATPAASTSGGNSGCFIATVGEKSRGAGSGGFRIPEVSVAVLLLSLVGLTTPSWRRKRRQRE